MGVLKADDPSVTQQRVEFVGPQVGRELFEHGALALLLVCIGIVALIYGHRKKLDRISIGQVWKPTGGNAPPPAATKA
jgi:hypothetical protein